MTSYNRIRIIGFIVILAIIIAGIIIINKTIKDGVKPSTTNLETVKKELIHKLDSLSRSIDSIKVKETILKEKITIIKENLKNDQETILHTNDIDTLIMYFRERLRTAEAER